MTAIGIDTLRTRDMLAAANETYAYYSLTKAAAQLGDVSRLPFSLKILLENLLRFEDGVTVTVDDIRAICDWQKDRRSTHEIQYRPARVLMQDFTGVPCIVDLAAMRDTMRRWGADASKINPQVPIHLVIDHSVMADEASSPSAFDRNVEIEYERNAERYAFLKWGASAFDNLKVVPPGTGICHQVNLEHLAQTVWTSAGPDGHHVAYPDTCVGTDSHTTMISGLGVLGWGVGGIEAEAAMLGQPVSMLIPDVIGFRLAGTLGEGVTATDLVLTITQMLRAHGVVGQFVEFFGPGLDALPLADRATIANMAPEYGATCGFFPIDAATIAYLKLTGRDPDRVALVEAYAKAQGMWRDATAPEPLFTSMLELDLSAVVPSVAGPRRPQDRVVLTDAARGFQAELAGGYSKTGEQAQRVPVPGSDFTMGHGDIAIAAITSCTNTSNPSVIVAAGLVARKARAMGARNSFARQPGGHRLSQTLRSPG
jgi:aconitate hydratase